MFVALNSNGSDLVIQVLEQSPSQHRKMVNVAFTWQTLSKWWWHCRCRSDEVRETTAKEVIAQMEAICSRRHVNCSIEVKHEAPAAACHPDIIAGLVDACRESEKVCAAAFPRRPSI